MCHAEPKFAEGRGQEIHESLQWLSWPGLCACQKASEPPHCVTSPSATLPNSPVISDDVHCTGCHKVGINTKQGRTGLTQMRFSGNRVRLVTVSAPLTLT